MQVNLENICILKLTLKESSIQNKEAKSSLIIIWSGFQSKNVLYVTIPKFSSRDSWKLNLKFKNCFFMPGTPCALHSAVVSLHSRRWMSDRRNTQNELCSSFS